MSILDEAREGMDMDTRPQDDLFGHVNGRWLEETEIPADRSSWGPFVELADAAEERVRLIIEDFARQAADATPDGALDSAGADATEARQIGDLFASFMDTAEIERRGTAPIRPLLEATAALQDVRGLGAYLGELERLGGQGVFGSYVTTDARDSERYLFHLSQGGLGLPDESYYREEKFAEIRTAYLAYLERLLALVDHPDAAGAAQAVLDLDTRLAAGHWERAETRDVQKTYNLLTAADLDRLCPAFDWAGYVRTLAGPEVDAEAAPGRGGRAAAVLPRAPLRGARRGPPRAVAVLAADPRAPLDRRLPRRRLRRGELRLLRPHPGRHPRAAGPLEARRVAGRGRSGRGRGQGVRGAALPAAGEGCDGRARRPTCWRPTGHPSRRWTG